MGARAKAAAAAAILVVTGVGLASADGVPWALRRRAGVRPNLLVGERVHPEDWPPEPDSPAHVDPVRFAEALEALCGWMPRGRAADYTAAILPAADEFDVDPFLLGALVQRMGRCDRDQEALEGIGLTLIPPRMYWHHVRDGTYRYFVREGGAWVERTLELDRHPFHGARLKRPEANLYFAAAFLRVWREQHPHLDEAFDQPPHRHHVSHFIWGDRVRSDRAEDRVLLDRRRLLQYYGAIAPPAPVKRLGLELGSPLDGAPRVISSFVGADRDGGDRGHRGVDVESVLGEPVRAVADGKVVFAGVDLPGRRNHERMTPAEIEAVPRSDLGRGGRYVCLLHDRDDGGWVRSCSMHLEDVEVRHGQQVERGDRIGTVGRTGMRRSAPHLHLELHGPDALLDPADVLRGFLIGRKVEVP
ncbi:MAG: M23 family metallopeptidase [Myxococcota bacterium]